MYRIRTRLMIAILLAALLPAVPMTVVVGNLLSRSLNPALHAELTEGLEAGLAESREALARRKADFLVAAHRAVTRPPRPNPGSILPPVVELDAGGAVTATSAPANRLERTEVQAGVRLIAGFLTVRLERPDGKPVVIAQRVPAEVADRAAQITEAVSLLAAYRFERASILRSYVLPFLLVYAVLIAIALAVAAAVSNRLARPIEDLAQAATAVAEGELDARVESGARGEVGALVHAFNDMVARLRGQRAELARLEKLSAWRDMARVLAHEIKNPLTPILLAVQQARTSYDGADPAHAEMLAECESIVTEEVEGLRDLVRSFSDFARPPQVEPKPTDVGDLLESLDRLYGERLTIQHDATMRAWPLDAAQIKRVLINLIDNGLTASERAGDKPGNPPQVTIRTTDFGDQLQIVVRDAGSGIPAEDLPRIFEPDFTTSTSGMGLGLPIAAGIVQAHGGTIKVATGPNGTDMTVALPWRTGEENA